MASQQAGQGGMTLGSSTLPSSQACRTVRVCLFPLPLPLPLRCSASILATLAFSVHFDLCVCVGVVVGHFRAKLLDYAVISDLMQNCELRIISTLSLKVPTFSTRWETWMWHPPTRGGGRPWLP